MGRADTVWAMDQLTDDMQRAMEGADATMTMIAHAEPASACLAPLLLNVSFEAAKNGIVRPTVCHGRPLLPWDVSGDEHPRYRHYAALAFLADR